MKLTYKSNLTAGIASTIMGGVLLWVIPNQIRAEKNIMYNVSSRTLPYLIVFIFLACGIALILQSVVFKHDTEKELILDKEVRIFLYCVVLLLYMNFFEKNFLFSTIALGVVTLFMTNTRKILYYIITIAVAIGLYFVFTEILHVRLP
jgi:hypothetical protein